MIFDFYKNEITGGHVHQIFVPSYGSLGHAPRCIEANRGLLHAFPLFHKSMHISKRGLLHAFPLWEFRTYSQMHKQIEAFFMHILKTRSLVAMCT
jgi:hypothetical protein